MARPKSVPKPPNGFVASAVGLPTMDRNTAGRRQSWQDQAWRFWETVGELRYPSTWIGNVMGRARLLAAVRDGNDLVPIEDRAHPANLAMEDLYGGVQGQTLMLQAMGTNLTIAGELYLTYAEDEWFVLASGKVQQQGKRGEAKVRIDIGREGGMRDLHPGEFVLRIWNPHPRNPQDADSPVRANLGTLSQINGYDQHIAAQLKSRLTGGGLLLLPSEIDFGIAPADGEDPQSSQAQRFMTFLAKAMVTPIANPSDPSAVVPVVAMVPGEHLDKAHLIKFWTDLDDKAVEMRDAAIKRLALGIDVPPEVLLGIADTNHWNAWLSEESAIKAHLEPRLSIITQGLTTGYLRHAIAGEVSNPNDYYVIADTAQIRLRPNRSQEAMELYDRGLLGPDPTLRETGFQSDDRMSDEERKAWMLTKVAIAASSPEQSAAALKALGIDLDIGPVVTNAERGRQPADDLRPDTIPDITRRDPPEVEEAREEALIASATAMMFRALERAGNRLRTLHPRTDTTAMAAHQVYMALSGDADDLLRGSWDLAPELLGRYCRDADDVVAVVETLDFYTRGVLSSRKAPNERTLRIQLLGRTQPVLEGSR